MSSGDSAGDVLRIFFGGCFSEYAEKLLNVDGNSTLVPSKIYPLI